MNETKMSDLAKRPLVSVIIPCFNREDYIRETIDSVLHQNYPNVELIVIDDGCTDNSRDILESYGKQIHLLEHPGRRNRGQSAAINLGLKKASGEFIAILDSDDLFNSGKIEKQVNYLIDHPRIGLVYGNGYAIDEHGDRMYKIYEKGHEEKSDPNRLLLDCYFLLPNNSLFRKNLLAKAGVFEESYRSAQDHDLAIRIMEVTKIAYIDEYLFFYRRHKNSISHRSAKVRWKNGYKILNNARKRYPYKLSTIIGRLAVLNFRLGQCYIEEKKYFLALALFLAAGLCNPLRSLRVITKREKTSGLH